MFGLFLGSTVLWGGYLLLSWGFSQIRGCNTPLATLAWPGRAIACNPDTPGGGSGTVSQTTTPSAAPAGSSRVETAPPGSASPGTPAGPPSVNLGPGSGQATLPTVGPPGQTTPPAPTF